MEIHAPDADRSRCTANDETLTCGTDAENVLSIDGARGSRQWTIKGITNDTVEVSREAAKRSGMKLNAWVGNALQRAAEDAPGQALTRPEADLVKRVAELEEYIRCELTRLREQGQSLEATVNGMTVLLTKLYGQK